VEHPFVVLIAAAILSIVAVLYTRARLQFNTGQEDLISADSRDSRNYLHYTHEFPDLDGAIVVVDAVRDPARAEMFADALAQKLNSDPHQRQKRFLSIDAGSFAGSALLYLSPGDLSGLAGRIRDHHDFISAYARDANLANFPTW